MTYGLKGLKNILGVVEFFRSQHHCIPSDSRVIYQPPINTSKIGGGSFHRYPSKAVIYSPSYKIPCVITFNHFDLTLGGYDQKYSTLNGNRLDLSLSEFLTDLGKVPTNTFSLPDQHSQATVFPEQYHGKQALADFETRYSISNILLRPDYANEKVNLWRLNATVRNLLPEKMIHVLLEKIAKNILIHPTETNYRGLLLATLAGISEAEYNSFMELPETFQEGFSSETILQTPVKFTSDEWITI
jgi:hypothetical protein